MQIFYEASNGVHAHLKGGNDVGNFTWEAAAGLFHPPRRTTVTIEMSFLIGYLEPKGT